MFIIRYIQYVSLLIFIFCSAVIANETKVDTTVAVGGNQIIVFPAHTLLDLTELVYANALVLDGDGYPLKGHKIRIIPQDKSKISVKSDSLITDEAGYVQFSIFAKQQGDTVIKVTDGVVSTQINVAIRNLIHYVLPYFYGNMQLNLINAYSEEIYVKIQFREKSERSIPSVIIRLEGKEMKTLKLSEELELELRDGWVELFSTGPTYGGVWTNKGYLTLDPVKDRHQ